VLFNLNETVSEPITITLTGQTSATTVTETTYDKAIYDLSGSPTEPRRTLRNQHLGSTDNHQPWRPNTPLSLTLTPWSMNVLIIN